MVFLHKAKGGCPKKKTSKIWTFGKKPLPYLPNVPIWKTKSLDIIFCVDPPSLFEKFGQISEKVCSQKPQISLNMREGIKIKKKHGLDITSPMLYLVR